MSDSAPTPLDPAEAAKLFSAGHPLAYASDPTNPFVCGQWLGQLSYITRLPFPEGGAEQYFTDNPAVLVWRSLDPTVPPGPPTSPPVVVDVPYASGPDGTTNANVGETASVTVGNWENTPDSYAYQWKNVGGDIAGATSSTYVLAAGDAGTQVFCNVTATNVVGSADVDSNRVSVAAASRHAR